MQTFLDLSFNTLFLEDWLIDSSICAYVRSIQMWIVFSTKAYSERWFFLRLTQWGLLFVVDKEKKKFHANMCDSFFWWLFSIVKILLGLPKMLAQKIILRPKQHKMGWPNKLGWADWGLIGLTTSSSD